jgi:hypothetical protein
MMSGVVARVATAGTSSGDRPLVSSGTTGRSTKS